MKILELEKIAPSYYRSPRPHMRQDERYMYRFYRCDPLPFRNEFIVQHSLIPWPACLCPTFHSFQGLNFFFIGFTRWISLVPISYFDGAWFMVTVNLSNWFNGEPHWQISLTYWAASFYRYVVILRQWFTFYHPSFSDVLNILCSPFLGESLFHQFVRSFRRLLQILDRVRRCFVHLLM